ncbi:MAG: DUF1330 domain-containing protein [Burkholderiales bacterium]|jgi:uncharacterized protein (DUF1330 family)
MTAYYVGTIRVTNVDAWQRYIAEVGATISAFGGEVMFRGRRADDDPAMLVLGSRLVVVLRFVDSDAARRWHSSPEYQRLVPMRDAGADVDLTLYAGTA